MIKVVLNLLDNPSNSQRAFALQAISILEQIVNHAQFHSSVISGDYTYRQYLTDDGSYENADNATVWAIISSGKEIQQSADQEIDIQCTFEKLDDDDDVMGAVDPPHPLITTNTVWLNWIISQGDPLSLAAHWMHEWMHVAGFVHPRSERIKFQDVTYSVGNIAVEVGELIIDNRNKSVNRAFLGLGYLKASGADSCNVYGPDE